MKKLLYSECILLMGVTMQRRETRLENYFSLGNALRTVCFVSKRGAHACVLWFGSELVLRAR